MHIAPNVPKSTTAVIPPPSQPGFLSHLRPAMTLISLFTVLTGVAFPLAFVAAGNLVFPSQANGSLIMRNGQVIGSSLIGQNFTSSRYLHGRPSALMGTDPNDSSKQVPTPYDASESGASNLAATSKTLSDRVAADLKSLGGSAPTDAVTTSASGLDPDISPDNAAAQVARIAAARKVNPDVVSRVISENTFKPLLGFIGEPRVNVLAVNLALDAARP